MKANELTKITASLPYCLYKVDERFFKIGDDYNTKIRFVKEKTTPNRRTQSSHNMETTRDRWGIDAHSDVEILTERKFDDLNISKQDLDISKMEDKSKAEKFTLDIINHFIKVYRYFNGEEMHLVPLTKEDFFGFSLYQNGHGMYSMSLAGGISTSLPLLTHRVSNGIEEWLRDKKEIPFWEELLMNAKQYIYQLNYRHSLLESVIALELVVSQFIIKKCQDKDIVEDQAKKYIKDVGIDGSIRISLKMMLDDQKLPEDAVFDKCKSSITIRNKVVHKGRKEVNKAEADDALKYTQELIEFLLKHM